MVIAGGLYWALCKLFPNHTSQVDATIYAQVRSQCYDLLDRAAY